MNSESRIERLRAWMRAQGFNAFVSVRTPNVAWLTGFENMFDYEEAHVAVVTPDEARFLTDSRYITAAEDRAQGSAWLTECELKDRSGAVESILVASGARKVAIENTMSLETWEKYRKAVSSELVATESVIETLRAVKDSEEIESIAAAQRITDTAFTHMLSVLKVGMTEKDIELELEFWMRRNGSEGVAFSAIVAGGPNSALPHASVSDREVRPGDFLVLDFGARVRGYCSDMTRTVVFGPVTEKHRQIYDAVLAANLAGIAACKAGVEGRAVDAAARQVIENAGFGEFFQHGLGHGVGLEIHELPNCGPRSEPMLEPGAVVTIEPGIYLPGFGGVRIEDLVVVEEGGCRVLTTSPKTLIEL